MLPQIVGPGTFTPSPFAPSAAERRDQGAQPDVGETAAAATRPEGANRVAPAKVIPTSIPLPEDRRRPDPLVPPDPDAPAGPPPAFDATPLERAREAAFAPADPIDWPAPAGPERGPPAPGAPAAGDAAEANAPAEDGRTGAPRWTDADTARRERMETEVAELRRMAEPAPDRALDLTR